MAPLVHHLQVSQSERVTFLCEELGIPYDLKIHKRAPLLAPPEYKALHPSGAAPIIQDGDLTLAESGACIEYLAHKYADGKLFLKPSHPDYAAFLYWWHWGNGTFQPTLGRGMLMQVAGMSSESSPIVATFQERVRRCFVVLDERLKGVEWLAGDEFTVADVMVVFSLTSFRYFYQYSLAEYPNILAYLQRISKREGYQRAMKKGDPEMELVLGADPPKPFAS